MIHQLPTLARLLKTLQQVPYLASKNVYLVAEHFLSMDPDQLGQFCQILREAQDSLIVCSVCNCWQEKSGSCLFCADTRRDQQVVCVVETWQDVIAIEKTQGYAGVYHVLGGAVCPLEGIGPEDLSIDLLIDRCQKGALEIILATNQTPEGEATAAFIARKIKPLNVTVSCLARGLPVGSSLGAMDRLTVYKALSERRPF